MKIIHVGILCIFLSLYFNVGSSRWMRRRITFAHASNGSLVVSTPPPITTQSPPVETRMEITTEAGGPIQKNTTQFLRGSEKFSFDILHVSQFCAFTFRRLQHSKCVSFLNSRQYPVHFKIMMQTLCFHHFPFGQ